MKNIFRFFFTNKENQSNISTNSLPTQRKQDIRKRLPLQINDQITFENGKTYLVKKTCITGNVNQLFYSLKWVNKPLVLTNENNQKTHHFSTLRELNYYVEQQRHFIHSIQKECQNPPLTFSVEEAYDLAKEEDEMREKLKQFMEIKTLR